MNRSTQFAAAAALLTCGAAGAWDYSAPDRAVRDLRAAAMRHDADAVNGFIDFPALRTNLNAQFAARLIANNTGPASSNPERTAARLASVKAMVDGLVSPHAIQVAMDRANSLFDAQAQPGSFAFQPIRRDGLNRFHLPLDANDRIAIRFERRGLDWKVADLKLPYDLRAAFARSPAPPVNGNSE